MGKLFVLIGKSASGKDAIYQRLLEDPQLHLKSYVGCTTRPMREGEENGREYFFVSEEDLNRIRQSGRLIECRTYHTVHGDWNYFSVDDGSLALEKQDYLYIGTLESFLPLREYYGADVVVPLYIQVEDGERLSRAVARERQQKMPRYAELCRRFLVDCEDFSEEKLRNSSITHRFDNIDFEACLGEIAAYIRQEQCFLQYRGNQNDAY